MGQSGRSPCCPAAQEPQGEVGVSQQLVGSLACPQQELLSEAGPGLAGGCVRLTATLGDASLGLCLSAGWETAFSLCSALWVLRSKTLYFCATRHGLIPSSFVKRLEKEIWIKELLLLAAARPQGFLCDYSKGTFIFFCGCRESSSSMPHCALFAPVLVCPLVFS